MGCHVVAGFQAKSSKDLSVFFLRPLLLDLEAIEDSRCCNLLLIRCKQVQTFEIADFSFVLSEAPILILWKLVRLNLFKRFRKMEGPGRAPISPRLVVFRVFIRDDF